MLSMASGIAARFETLLGRDYVSSDPSEVDRYAIDGVGPEVVLRPRDTEQITGVLRVATEMKWTVVPHGGGTRQHAGLIPERVDIVLSTEHLHEIQAYDPGDLTIAVQAGARVSRLVALCAQNRQLLAIEAPEGATVGGALASAESGPLRTGFGAIRDFCIGITFVTADGVSGRGGGRVVKNVAGYDLMKLMIGSHGSLGVIVSANFKVFPLPQQLMTCICKFDSLAEVIQFRDWLLKSPLTPIAAELMNPSAIDYLTDADPRDPDHWAPDSSSLSQEPTWQMLARFAGSDRVLTRSKTELGSSVSRELRGADEADLWRRFAGFEDRLMQRHRNAMVFRVDLPIAESHSMIEAAQSSATNYNFVAAVVGRATVGAYLVAFAPLAIDPPSVTQFAGAASDFRSRLSRNASAVVLRCPVEAKHHFDVWGSTPTDRELMRKIKHALDPEGILNRGRYLIG